MILLLETVHTDAQAMLEDLGELVVVSDRPTLEQYSASHDLRAIVTRGIGRVPAQAFIDHPELEVVARCGVGLDNIDTDAASKAGVPVVHAPGSTTQSVAEHALMLMLALARQVTGLNSAVAVGNWRIRDGYEGIEMRGKRLGIVGLGAIGSRVAEFGAMLGMDVVATPRGESASRVARLPFDELLRTSDVVQLCLPLSDETRGIVGADQLASMKSGALLINTARGALVVNAAVEHALEAGTLGGYAADVWDPEPPDSLDPLLAHRCSTITPHIAALTDVTYREICVRTAAAVVAVIAGVEPDPSSVYRGAVTAGGGRA